MKHMELYAQLFVLSNYTPSAKTCSVKSQGKPFYKTSQIQGFIDQFFYGLYPEGKYSLFLEDSGRPCVRIKDSEQKKFSLDFNLSHSKDGLALAMIGGNMEGARVGCDIEKLRPRKNLTEIANDFFFPEEVKWIFDGDEEDKIERFYRIWTAKEAWLKYYGKSIFDISLVPTFVTTSLDRFRSLEFPQFILLSPSKDTYVVTIATSCPLLKENLYLEEGWCLRSCEQIYAAESPVNTVSPKM